MRKSLLVKGWGIVIAVLLCVGAITSIAGGANGKDGIKLNINDMPFNQLVDELVKQSDGKQLVLLDDVSTPVSIVITDPTPINTVLEMVCTNVGLSVRLEGNTYYVGKPDKINARLNSLGNQSPTVAETGARVEQTPYVQTPPVVVTTMPGQNEDKSADQPIIRMIQLNYLTAREMTWAFGYPGTQPISRDRKRDLTTKFETVLGNRNRVVDSQSQSGRFSSPMYQNIPWSTGEYNDRSTTDGNQAFPPAVGGGGVGLPPVGGGGNVGGLPPIGGVIPPVGGVGTGTATGTQSQGLLRSFLPLGIEQIVGIESLNTLLVRATNQESIDNLAGLIKMLDKPTKQVLIEVMFVKMTVNDAMSLGSSWTIQGNPWSVVNTGASASDGNFSVMYINGNIKFALSSLITNKRAKVVNAPRIIVQNGADGAYIQLTDSFPFIITQQSEDVFGRTTQIPEIVMQPFEQGMDINSVLIHSDNSVTLDVTPTLEDPTDSLAIPGTGNAGSVSSTQTTEISTVVRVKNGETIMMGGFVSNNEGTAMTKTPLLADIPILGPLFFRNSTTSTNNTETLIFITPTVLEDDKTTFEGMITLPPIF